MNSNPAAVRAFRKKIWDYYHEHGRHDLPWRKTRDPYKILVSEIMLQQTQVARVFVKYPQFLKEFPTAAALATASTGDVLKMWQGLGYNRRALALKRCAEIVTEKYGGKFPRTFDELVELPSIGPATAADLLAFAWNIPRPLTETNIRTVYIHFFFPEREEKRARADKTGRAKISCKVDDKEVWPLVEKTFDREQPREWIWALMDYGAMLKKEHRNASGRRSAQYVRQSKFEGSNRELRSNMVKIILGNSGKNGGGREGDGLSTEALRAQLRSVREKISTADFNKNLKDLEREGFIFKEGDLLRIAK